MRLSFGVPIVYQRPGVGSVNLTVIRGESVQEVDRDGQVVQEHRTRDYLVQASELVIEDSLTTPQRHDMITEDGETYQVLAINGEPHWRYTDRTKTVLRIHCKES